MFHTKLAIFVSFAIASSYHDFNNFRLTWDTPRENSYMFLPISQENETWQNYFLYVLNKALLTNGLLRHYLHATFMLVRQRQTICSQPLTKDLHFLASSHSPCGSMYYKSLHHLMHLITWTIYVNQAFMVNVTITKAYTLYSDDCLVHNIAVFDLTIALVYLMRMSHGAVV